MEKRQINTIPGYENVLDYYWIYSDGRLWSDYKQDFMKPAKHYNSNKLRDQWLKGELEKEPYYVMYVGIRVKGKTQPNTYSLHKIVADAFIPNPYNLPEINHKDKNTENNNVNNLEWIEKEKNIKLGLSKKVWCCNKDTHEPIYLYNSIADAARALDCPTQNIIAVCKGRRKSCKNYFWKYNETP